MPIDAARPTIAGFDRVVFGGCHTDRRRAAWVLRTDCETCRIRAA
jgi:hypothetical protein